MVASFSNFSDKTWLGFCLKVFNLKPTERAQVLLKSGTKNFQNNPRFERSACFYVIIIESFKRCPYFNFGTLFSGKRNPFQLKPVRLKIHHFHSKLLCQKPMLRQIEWRLQNGTTTKRGVFPVTTFCLWKILSSFRTSLKE